MDFLHLSNQIEKIDYSFSQSAGKAVNVLLTSRNWLIGFYLVEYEHNGKDRGSYGKSLTEELAKRLKRKGLSSRNLWLYRQFFLAYPEIGYAVASTQPTAIPLSSSHSEILQSPTAEFIEYDNWVQKQNPNTLVHNAPDLLILKLSFTHFTLLTPIKDRLKRTFYETEAIRGTWSVRELKRQINSLYYERAALSTSPDKLRDLTEAKRHNLPAITTPARSLTKDIYTFEFLEIPEHLAVEEQDLESALLDNLRSFLLEMGHGFCFEARQKRILIGEEYFYIDLVFYHRILKCHVLVELKVGDFSHESAGQLNTYLNYYRKKIMEKDDNPPVGLLLVAEQNSALVEYATAGMDNNLFVKKYLLKLPDQASIKAFIQKAIKEAQYQ